MLASGGRDTDVILWDLITESGLYRLRGHKVREEGFQFVLNRMAASPYS